ncbi:MAG: UDP-N-acetylmuramoyl-tripeptide--D-alanyl-D-alanine ligase [Bacteroidetes bacterium]|nr:UDP-N-acetylmuramoyl-tripeptide--D-alanyl-D-alanine ligase [Bacteroidota bacterium]
MQTEELYKIFLAHPSLQTDSRKLNSGDIFFALKGDLFNGNTFARQAIEAGAAYAVIDEPQYEIPGKTILVKNTLNSLQQLAKYHRRQFNALPAGRQVPFLAITGSNGKTTTKELIHAILSTTFKTYTTEGNLNNHIGIPLTILKIKEDAQIAVIEMGANHQKEIASYCAYTMPTHGLITNCGKAHLEGFGGVEGVRKGKGELFDYLRSYNGTAFIMQDYAYLQEMSGGIAHILRYGTKHADIEGCVLKNEPFLEVEINKGVNIPSIKTQLVGDYNFPNVLAAVAVGNYFKVPAEKIKMAIENYTPSNSRSQLIERGTNKIILDAYNANPSSMKLAIENFANLRAENKVLMLGGMAELGSESIDEHKAMIDLIKQHSWKAVVLVGSDFIHIPHPFISLENSAEAKEWLQAQRFENTHLLVKGSRSMQMEKVLEP